MIANQVNVTSKTEIANSNKIVKGEDDMIYDFSEWTHVYSGNSKNSYTELPDTANAKVIAIMASNDSTSVVPVNVINLIQGNGVTVLQYPPNSINVFIFSHNNNLGIKISSTYSLPFHIFMKK